MKSKLKDLKVKQIDKDGYEQIEISQKSDSPDPRVGGTKIIFDSRLDDITKGS